MNHRRRQEDGGFIPRSCMLIKPLNEAISFPATISTVLFIDSLHLESLNIVKPPALHDTLKSCPGRHGANDCDDNSAGCGVGV